MAKVKTAQAAVTFTHKGVSITVSPNGKFVAAIDDLEISVDTLEAAKTKINNAIREVKEKKPIALKVVGLLRRGRYGNSSGGELQAATLVGVHRSTRQFQFAPGDLPKDMTLDPVLADTEANRAALARRLETERAADVASERVSRAAISVNGYGRIETVALYESLVDSIQQAYAKSAKVK